MKYEFVACLVHRAHNLPNLINEYFIDKEDDLFLKLESACNVMQVKKVRATRILLSESYKVINQKL